MITNEEKQQLGELPKPTGTANTANIFTWQKGYSAALKGKPSTDNPYNEHKNTPSNPGYRFFQWWNKGYKEGYKFKQTNS